MKNEIDQKLRKLSFKHYEEYLNIDNEKDSPYRWIFYSFATVRGLMRIPHDKGYPEVTNKLLDILEKDIEEFKESLKLIAEEE